VPDVVAAKGRHPLVMVTAYDAPTARLADAGGADMILVGDSLGMVVLGYESTLEVTVDDIVHHAAAVRRARPRCLIIGDMPWLSYHTDRTDAVRNAGRLVATGGCAAVKVEGGRKRLPVIEALLDAEIPVMGHIGLTPQSVHQMGGFRVQGKDLPSATSLVDAAKALAATGVFAIVLEGVPREVAEVVTRAVDVPTIGIGAGPACDGQVLVMHDLLGLTPGPLPKFARRFADLHGAGAEAVARYCDAVRDGTFPADAESYHLPEAARSEFLARFSS
jgi:3-methyl-2-oxobutanoate hydroxymethyltransferase